MGSAEPDEIPVIDDNDALRLQRLVGDLADIVVLLGEYDPKTPLEAFYVGIVNPVGAYENRDVTRGEEQPEEASADSGFPGSLCAANQQACAGALEARDLVLQRDGLSSGFALVAAEVSLNSGSIQTELRLRRSPPAVKLSSMASSVSATNIRETVMPGFTVSRPMPS